MMGPNLAFMGKAGAGKTAAARALEETRKYTRLSFAGPLKQVATEIWGTGAIEDRDKLQRLGVAVREIDEDAWVNLMLRKVVAPGASKVVDDLRFPNEYWALKQMDFVIVRVEAPRTVRIDRLKANGKWQDADQLEHESETALDEYDPHYTLVNDATPEDFVDRLSGVIRRERARVS